MKWATKTLLYSVIITKKSYCWVEKKEWWDYGIVLATIVMLKPPAISSINPWTASRLWSSLPKRSTSKGLLWQACQARLGVRIVLLELFQYGWRGLAYATGRFLNLLFGLLHGHDHPDTAGSVGKSDVCFRGRFTLWCCAWLIAKLRQAHVTLWALERVT